HPGAPQQILRGIQRSSRPADPGSDESGLPWARRLHGELRFAARQIALSCADENLDVELRVTGAEGRQVRHEPVRGELGRDGQTNASGYSSRARARSNANALGCPLDSLRGRQQLLAKRRRQVSGGSPMKEGSTERRFERREPPAHGRVLDAKFTRSNRDAPRARHGKKYTQVVPVHTAIFAQRVVRKFLWRRRS